MNCCGKLMYRDVGHLNVPAGNSLFSSLQILSLELPGYRCTECDHFQISNALRRAVERDIQNVHELADVWLSGSGYWYCKSCRLWHEDEGTAH